MAGNLQAVTLTLTVYANTATDHSGEKGRARDTVSAPLGLLAARVAEVWPDADASTSAFRTDWPRFQLPGLCMPGM